MEAATSRLEDIATSVDGSTPGALNGATGTKGVGVLAGTGAEESTATITPAPEPTPAEPLPKQIEEFDELIHGDVTAFTQAAGQVGGLVEEQVCTTRPTKCSI